MLKMSPEKAIALNNTLILAIQSNPGTTQWLLKGPRSIVVNIDRWSIFGLIKFGVQDSIRNHYSLLLLLICIKIDRAVILY